MKQTKLILTAIIAIVLGASNAAYAFDPNGNLSLNPNKYDNDGWTPAHHLAKLGEHRKLRTLISKNGGKPHLKTRDDYQQTPLHIAAQYGHAKAVEALLGDKRVKVDAWDTWGGTALHYAAGRSGKGRVVEILLGAGADADQKDLRGITPLHAAAQRGSPSAIEALVKAGAEVNALDDIGRTPMHHAARHDRNNVIYLLSLNGAGKEDKDNAGLTPLQLAVSFGMTKSARELKKIGAKTNMFTDWDKNGRKAIHNAAFHGNAKMVKTLIDLGYDKEAKGRDDWRALHYAARNNHADVVQALIDEGVYIYAETKKHSAKAIELAEAHHGYESDTAEMLRARQYDEYIVACSSNQPVWFCDMTYPAWRLANGNNEPIR